MIGVAVTTRTLWLLGELRKQVGGATDNAVRDLTAAWVAGWDELAAAWTDAIAEIVADAVATGAWPTRARLARLARLATAGEATHRSLTTLTGVTVRRTTAAAQGIVDATAAAEPAIMASQLPAKLAKAALGTYARRIMPSALEAIVVRARQQITVTTWPLTADATDAVRRSLIRGIALGAHPREVARAMLTRVQGDFNGGLARAVNVARTELLDAYRAASGHVHDANADVLDGWTWIASLDVRACSGCWGMHGTVHLLSQPGPWGHQSCRCARAPKVKSWRDLGIDLPEPADLTPDAAARFAALTAEQQRQVVGPARLGMLQAGTITLADLPVLKDNPGWRPSYVPATLAQLGQVARSRA